MPAYFWHNTIWYLGLLSTSIACLSVTLAISKNRAYTFGFWLSVLGLTYFLEIMLKIVLNAYSYHPMVFPDDPFFDSIIGNIFSQVSVSSSAVLLCTLRFKTRARAALALAAFAAVYYAIDAFFSHIGIYEHHWYRSIYSFAGFIVYGAGIMYWHKIMASSPPGYILIPSLFMGAFAAVSNTLGVALKAVNLRYFQPGFFAEASRDHTVFSLFYAFVPIVIFIALYKRRARGIVKIFVFAAVFACQLILVSEGVMRTAYGLGPVVALADIAGYYGAVLLEDRLLSLSRNT